MPKITVLRESCKGVEGCGICIFVCPADLFESSDEMNSAGYIPPRMIDESRCTECESCMISCPDMAVIVEKDRKEAAP